MRAAIIVGIFLISVVTALPSLEEYEDDLEDYEDVEAENAGLKISKEQEDYSYYSDSSGANNQDPVEHEDTIALQTFVRNHYVSCAGHRCGRSGCPAMDMTGKDWNRCWGEVFQIYRREGPGIIKVGDYVGLYYPREKNRWLGCAHQPCGKYPCPGSPTHQFGFHSKKKWNHCWGEVFQIFVKGKKTGSEVLSDDEVAFYYPRTGKWVAVGFGRMFTYPCLGRVHHNKAPPLTKYDRCVFETFRLWKKPLYEV